LPVSDKFSRTALSAPATLVGISQGMDLTANLAYSTVGSAAVQTAGGAAGGAAFAGVARFVKDYYVDHQPLGVALRNAGKTVGCAGTVALVGAGIGSAVGVLAFGVGAVPAASGGAVAGSVVGGVGCNLVNWK
jgi:hypothetical protein